MRTTKTYTEAIFADLLRVWEQAGVDTTDLIFVSGSVTYGRRSQIARRDPVTGSQGTLMSLSPSPSKATRELVVMICALDVVRVYGNGPDGS